MLKCSDLNGQQYLTKWQIIMCLECIYQYKSNIAESNSFFRTGTTPFATHPAVSNIRINEHVQIVGEYEKELKTWAQSFKANDMVS